MKRIKQLITNKIIKFMPALFERKAGMFEEQVDVLLRNMEDKGIKRIYATQAEIDRMLAIGETMDHDVEDCLKIVKISTYKRWLSKRRGGEVIKRPGQKRSTPVHIINLILRFVKENPGWGIRRIVGELWKLKYKISNSTVYKVCKDNGVPMPPNRCKRKPFSSWHKFVKANMASIVSCDLFTKNIHTFRGKFQAFSIVFIHYASRRVYVSPPTYNPDNQWMMQQARNVSMWLEDEGIELKYLIRDGDKKYSKRFDEFFSNIIKDNNKPDKSRGRVIKTHPRCPPQNGYVESWIGHLKQECLRWFVCFSLSQFDRIISSFEKYHNEYRPHQGLANIVISPDFKQPKGFDISKVKKKSFLSGILNHYYIDEEENFANSDKNAA